MKKFATFLFLCLQIEGNEFTLHGQDILKVKNDFETDNYKLYFIKRLLGMHDTEPQVYKNVVYETITNSLEDLSARLYQLYSITKFRKAFGIQYVTVQGIPRDANGYLVASSIPLYLERAYQEKKLPFEAFKSAQNLKVKRLLEVIGHKTTQLFSIEATYNGKFERYIFKEMMQKYSEAKHLIEFYNIKNLESLLWPHHKRGYASLIIPIAFIAYEDHYFSLMPHAPGVVLSQFMKQYVENPSLKNGDLVKRAYASVGRSIARFHKTFMEKSSSSKVLKPTIVHSGLHHHNIFYNPHNDEVTLIDNDTMYESFKNPKEIQVDIDKLLFYSTIPLEYPKGIKYLPLVPWLTLTLPSFLSAYIHIYPPHERHTVFNEMKKYIKKGFYYQKQATDHTIKHAIDALLKQVRNNI